MENQSYEQNNTINLNELPRLRNGAMWYVAILPALGLYLENYALNKWLGILIWAFVLIVGRIICFRDMKRLEKLGYPVEGIKTLSAVFPLIYMYKRCRLLKQSNIIAVFFTIFTVYAVIDNGFTLSLQIDDQTFTDQVKYSYVINLEGYSDISGDVSYNIVGEQIDAFINEEEAEYKVSAEGDLRYITVSGSCDYNGEENAALEIVFVIDYDGYAFKSFRTDSVTVSGKALEDEEKWELLDEILLNSSTGTKSNGDSVIQQEDSSNYKTA